MNNTLLVIIAILVIAALLVIIAYTVNPDIFSKPSGDGEQPPLPPGFKETQGGEEQPPSFPE
jgi:hypothetical protein